MKALQAVNYCLAYHRTNPKKIVKPRNHLTLELMGRGGMRVSEVLKLTPKDVEGRKKWKP